MCAKKCRRSFLLHYRSLTLLRSSCYAWKLYLLRMDLFTSGWVRIWLFLDRTPRTCPHDFGKVFPLPTDFGQSVSGFHGLMWAPHLSGADQFKSQCQVRFKCLFTPRCGPNNKPLAFAVPGSHSCELVWALSSLAPLVRLAYMHRQFEFVWPVFLLQRLQGGTP